MLFLKGLPFAALPLLVSIFPLGTESLPVANDATLISKSPCAEVGYYMLQTDSTTVPAELAYECLKSVPLHATEAKALHRSLPAYLEWHTTFSYVKDPPAKYQMPAYDFWATFDHIRVKLENGSYLSEWEFGMDLYRTFNNVYDSHLFYILDVVGKAFHFRRDVSLVSVSENGYSLPEVYVQDDILKFVRDNVSFPSAVLKINGQPVQTYLNTWMQDNPYHDYDTLYNALFWSATQDISDDVREGYTTGFFSGGGASFILYPGPLTYLLFANGTTRSYPNFAQVQVNFTNITDGNSFYHYFCTPPPPAPSPTPSQTSTSTPKPPAADRPPTLTYPTPIARHPKNYIAGYFLPHPSHAHMAILSIPSFIGSRNDPDHIYFQRTIANFLHASQTHNKTKLIIDLRGNQGGTILLAYELFAQLFPALEQEPWGLSRFRAHAGFNAVGLRIRELAREYREGRNLSNFNAAAATAYEPYSPALALDAEGRPFGSWEELYGPVHLNNDTFTHTIRFNLSSAALWAYVAGLHHPTYLALRSGNGSMEPPFRPQDIVLLHDGECASTCATFSDLMRTRAGIRSVVVGGRPRYAAMQSVGGVRGMQIYRLAYLWGLMQDLGLNTTNHTHNTTEGEGQGVALDRLVVDRMAWMGGGAVNVRDSLLRVEDMQDAQEGMPSQFLYVPAECRLFYTAEMVLDVARTWERVAEVVWGEEQLGGGAKGAGWARCVVGDL